ncbi:Hypothetical predicted protein [Olea europaea subsp. europaea]|uniref:Uncharacterized protein n=1 Tax=Olea europaea subsp. europaea TaxID=158383 RepID=A0A8S0U202_OLEEU|nr:Hypothetical predicted protein [Olea europaea subsp. europaea]
MASLFICINCTQFKLNISESEKQQRGKTFTLHAAKSGGFSLKSITSKCQTCRGEGAIECSGCKGTGKNKKNGNIFERWKTTRRKIIVPQFYWQSGNTLAKTYIT